eukprot:3021007-Prymnesium_polylepis.1
MAQEAERAVWGQGASILRDAVTHLRRAREALGEALVCHLLELTRRRDAAHRRVARLAILK